jgi:hypothetical protein
VLAGIVTLLTVSAWITAVQRIAFVYRATTPGPGGDSRVVGAAPGSAPDAAPGAPAAPRSDPPDGTAPASRADGARHALT